MTALYKVKLAFIFCTVITIVVVLSSLFHHLNKLGQQMVSSDDVKLSSPAPTPTNTLAGETRQGYVMANSFWEQHTSASRNLHGLQCWAGKIGMSVVEPFIKGSHMETPLSHKNLYLMRYSDLYNLDHWNNLSRKKGYAILKAWEEFIKMAPRNVIAVSINYIHKKGKKNGSCSKLLSSQVDFLKKFNFRVARESCINLEQGSLNNLDSFYETVFGHHQPHNSTVIFSMWRGFNHIQFTGSGCGQTTAHIEAEPSKRVIRDAQRYAEKYLNVSSFITVMVRMEKAKILMQKQAGSVTYCYRQTLQHWRKLVQSTGMQVTFLSSDVGKFGSSSFRSTGDETKLDDVFLDFFNELYNNSLTVKQWEDTFVHTSGSSERGYISMLQKVVAVRAKCILFVGGGAYQKNSLHLYYKTHSAQDRCIETVSNCTRSIQEEYHKMFEL